MFKARKCQMLQIIWYSKILLIRHAWTRDVPDNWVFQVIRQDFYWPQFLQVAFSYFSYTTNQWSNTFWCPLYLPVQDHQDPVLSYWSLNSWRSWWSRKWGPGDTIPVYLHSWRPFWTCSCDLPVSLMMFLSGKMYWYYSPQCWIIRISDLSDYGLKKFCCILN